MSETIDLALPSRPLRYPIELVGRVVRGLGSRPGLEYRLVVPLNVPCALLARPVDEPGYPFRHGIAQHDGVSAPDLTAISALCEGDYLYRIGKPLTPSLDERITAIERLLGIVADDLEVAADAEESGDVASASLLRTAALRRIRDVTQKIS